MNRNRWLRLPLMGIALGLVWSLQASEAGSRSIVLAQNDGENAMCSSLIQDALAEIATTCLDIGRNEICYGHSAVSATLTDGDLYFEAPGDIVPVSAVEAVITRVADLETSEWGIALMDVQVDLPEGVGSVRLVMFGGTEVTPAEGQLVADQTTCNFTNTGDQNINLRAGAGTNYRVVDILDRGSSLEVFGRSLDGEWLRSSRGWVYTAIGELGCEADSLATFAETADAYTAPMQAFTLQVNESAECVATPPGMLIQVPDGQVANMMVNNVELRVGSTAFLTITEDENEDDNLLVANLDGNIFTTSDGVTFEVYTGGQSLTPLDENGQAQGPPSQFEPFGDEVGGLPTELLTNGLPTEIGLPDPIVLSSPASGDQGSANGDSVPLGEWGTCGSCAECEGPDGECRIDPSGVCVWDPSGCNPVGPSLSCSSLCGSSVTYMVGEGDSFVMTLNTGDGATISDLAPNTNGLNYVSESITNLSPTQIQVDFSCTYFGGPGMYAVSVFDSMGRAFQVGFTLTCI